jgi:NAD-dependent deacetylase
MTPTQTLADYIKQANYIVAFTGAGISTSSGIPDFRSSSGLYSSGDFDGMHPEDILTRKCLREKPALVMRFYKERLMRMVDKEPNKAHYALKQLEATGKLKWIATQNIDNLHRKAGSKNVLDLHGNGTRFRCTLKCGRYYNYEQFVAMIEKDDVPKCDCLFGYVRPDVVLFDEALDDDVFDKAYYESKQCDLMIVVGSSLRVMPACSLLSEIDKEKCKLVIVNKESTPYDSRANLIIHENCSEALDAAVKAQI